MARSRGSKQAGKRFFWHHWHGDGNTVGLRCMPAWSFICLNSVWRAIASTRCGGQLHLFSCFNELATVAQSSMLQTWNWGKDRRCQQGVVRVLIVVREE